MLGKTPALHHPEPQPSEGPDWRTLNNVTDIPDDVHEEFAVHTYGRRVIDFGAGENEAAHIDYHARSITRWDKTGVISCDQPHSGRNLQEILARNSRDDFVIVFSRVISVLSQRSISNLRAFLSRNRHRLRHALLYDYAYNRRRLDEYDRMSGPLGLTFELSTEWSAEPFYHYTECQFSLLFGSMPMSMRTARIPAVRRSNDTGLLSVFSMQ